MSSSTATDVALMTEGSAWMVIWPLVVVLLLLPSSAGLWGAATRMLKGRQLRMPLKKGSAVSTVTGLGTAAGLLVLVLPSVSGAGLEAPVALLAGALAGALAALIGAAVAMKGLEAAAAGTEFGCPSAVPRSWPADKHTKAMMQAALSSPLRCRSCITFRRVGASSVHAAVGKTRKGLRSKWLFFLGVIHGS